MNKYEEALKEVVETFNTSIIEGRFLTRSNLDLLKKLVIRATPRKPKEIVSIEFWSKEYQCPNCDSVSIVTNHELSIDTYCKYCPDCGQAIDWEEEKE